MTLYQQRRQRKNWIDTPESSQINLGFPPRYNNQPEPWQTPPRIQVWIHEEKPKAKQIQYCSKCNNRVQWIETSRKYLCYCCGLSYNELYDMPLSSIDQAIQPLQGEGSLKPFFASMPVNKRLEGEYQSGTIEETRSFGNGRVKQIKLRPGVSPLAYNIREDL